MPILLEPDPNSADTMGLAITGDVTVVESGHAVHRALEQDPDELLVVIGTGFDLAAALDLATEYRVHRPEVGFVLLRRRVDVTVLGQALRAGVREVVHSDDLTAIADACRRSRELSQSLLGAAAAGQGGEGRVVTVFSAKGGCGKTTLATNLAVALADGGRSTVCLVDLDLAFGDVAIAMQLVPARTITDAIAMQGTMDPTGVESLLTPHSPGVSTILAPLEPGEADHIPVATITELIRTLRAMFDYVVIDSPPAFTEHVLAAFDLADVYLLLATLDIPALKNLRLTLDTLKLLGYSQDSVNVVLNRSDSKVGLTISDVEKALSVPIAAQIPSSSAVSISINRGVPLVLDQPKHPVSQAIQLLADTRVRRTPAGQLAEEPALGGRHRRRFAFVRREATT
jgi:pilus assembly protein CpaE